MSATGRSMVCTSCKAVIRVGVNATTFICPSCGALNSVSPEVQAKASDRRNQAIMIAFGVLQVAGALLVAGALVWLANRSDSTSDDTLAVDERTCEIARQIGRDYNVTDTLSAMRRAVVDLYQSYGKSTSTAIQLSLKDWAAGMRTEDFPNAAQDLQKVSDACAAEGF